MAVSAGVLAPGAPRVERQAPTPVHLTARNAAATTPSVPSPPATDPEAVAGFGTAPVVGAPGTGASAPVVGIARTPSGNGYWVATADGAVFAYGDATFHGSLGGTALNRPVVGIAATPDGGGYWLVASDGGVFSFGNAAFRGSMGATPLNSPVVGVASSATGRGYWLVAADGGVFTFGDAVFHGSLGAVPLASPVVGVAGTRSGGGYWLAAADGGVFTFGDATFHGSLGGIALNAPVTAMAPSPSGDGYWLAAADGGVFTFGDALYNGSLTPEPAGTQVTAIAPGTDSGSYWLATAPRSTARVAAQAVSGTSLGSFVITCYDLGGRTATGVAPSMATVAVDPSVIPLGSTISIAGVGTRVAQDTGGAIQGHRLDLWLPSYAACAAWGVQTREVSRVG